MQKLCDEIEKVINEYSEVWQNLQKETTNEILTFKISMWQETLWKSKTELVYYLKELLSIIFKVFVCTTDDLLHLILK